MTYVTHVPLIQLKGERLREFHTGVKWSTDAPGPARFMQPLDRIKWDYVTRPLMKCIQTNEPASWRCLR